ncbi:MAG: pseudouridine synthase [Oligoflexales bacterium]
MQETAMQNLEFVVQGDESQQPLEKYLLDKTSFSRRKVRRLIDQGGVRINRSQAWKAAWKVVRGDRISIRFSSESLQVSTTKLSKKDLLYRKNGLIVVNKPPRVVSASGKGGILKLVQDSFRIKENLYLCHRLDKETSGVLLLADSKTLADQVMDEFRHRRVKKIYHALTVGQSSQQFWETECHLKTMQDGKVHVVHAGGQVSKTDFECIARGQATSFVRCFPTTGRTHQIRVHLALAGLPILGDKIYGDPRRIAQHLQGAASVHHLLHARALEMDLAGETLRFVAPHPGMFEQGVEAAGIDPDALKQDR